MKKQSYNTKSSADLATELSKLKETLRSELTDKVRGSKKTTYRATKKNIARVLTAMNAQASASETRQTAENA